MDEDFIDYVEFYNRSAPPLRSRDLILAPKCFRWSCYSRYGLPPYAYLIRRTGTFIFLNSNLATPVKVTFGCTRVALVKRQPQDNLGLLSP